MKILFLDVDGVLNCRPDYAVRYPGMKSVLLVNQLLVERLQQVLKDTGAQVVLSSTWRKTRGGREFLEECGIPILDVTDCNGPKRGDEIQRWINLHAPMSLDFTYAIVDDDSDMLDHQLPRFVLTEFATGLTEQAAYRLTYKLNNAG